MDIGQYEILRKIGEGSFGRTFEGRHHILGIPACIKQERTGDPVYQRMFREEAELLAKVHHISLPAFRDYFELPDFGQVLVMSYISGENLRKRVDREGAIDDEHIAWILQRTLDALSYLHFQCIVHCDVKPENLILHLEEHNVVLVDFGLGVIHSDAKTLAKGGTEAYMPPEFGNGLPPIPASDIYSIGKTAVFLSGGNPMTGALPKDMHPLFAECIRAMIRKDPFARPQNARDVSRRITEIRRQIFGRTETTELFKLRERSIS
jgi:serine/threonine protein kinase